MDELFVEITKNYALRNLARTISGKLHATGFPPDPDRQMMCLAEEVGEFVGAYRRASGRARRPGPMANAYEELADVVIAAYVMADELGINLDSWIATKAMVVFSRGWKVDDATE